MTYKLLAVDIDRTLIGPDGIVPAETVAALTQAQRAGLRVCLATGRAPAESLPVWSQLHLEKPFEPLICLSGALVCEPDPIRTLFHRPIAPALACEFADAVAESGYSAIAAVDPWRTGLDYYFAQCNDAEAIERLWFARMRLEVRRVKRFSDDPAFPPPLRLNAVPGPHPPEDLAQRLARRFDGRLIVRPIEAPNLGLTLLEAFCPDVDKFLGVQYLAQSYRIPPGQIVCVGDDVNDLGMIARAGLGVAVPQAVPAVREAADHFASDGLGPFIERLLAGQFDA